MIGGSRSNLCIDNAVTQCSEIGLNTFEQVDTMRYPQGDIMNAVKRGSITKAWNLGLRNPQAKKLSVDVFNGGCVDPHGCVAGVGGQGSLAPDVPGFKCSGAAQRMGQEMSKAYDFLNAPLLEDGFEFRPPTYMMGLKDSGPNSVDGWAKTASGNHVFAEKADVLQALTFVASGRVPPVVPGCG